MDKQSLALAARIIARSSRRDPADAVLRSELKAQKGLHHARARQITDAVFAYFRWFGWLDAKIAIEDQIAKAIDLARQFATLERGQPCPRELSDTEMGARTVSQWVTQELTITTEWAHALQTPPTVWLRARPGSGPDLAKKLGDCVPFGEDALADVLDYRGEKDLFRTKEFHAGEFELQDLSSQAVSLICAPKPGETWWDACAGEGGKMLHLCSLMGNKGLVWATDRAEWRLKKLKRRAARARTFNYRAREWNGGPILPFKTKFDGVLVDAPCSGIGTWQRNPHARWTTSLQDIHELSQTQFHLLQRAADAIKPKGKLVYAVCTLSQSETTEVAEKFEQNNPGFKRLPFSDPLSAQASPIAQLFLRTENCGGNGMFIAAWQRQG